MKQTIFLKLTFFYHQCPHNLHEIATVVERLLQDPKLSHRTGDCNTWPDCPELLDPA